MGKIIAGITMAGIVLYYLFKDVWVQQICLPLPGKFTAEQ
jgi:hypothetical protein